MRPEFPTITIDQITPSFCFPFSARQGPSIKRVIFNNPATVVFWTDGSKTVVKVGDGDEYDPEKGVLLAYMKKGFGAGYYRELKRKIAEAQIGGTE